MEVIPLEETAKELKTRKLLFYKIARRSNIPAVKIELERNNRIVNRIPHNQGLIRKAKTIFGRKWNPKEKHQEVPYDENLISKLQPLLEKNSGITPLFYHPMPLQKGFSIGKYFRSTIVKNKRVSTSTLNLIINALKFFYVGILNKGFTYNTIFKQTCEKTRTNKEVSVHLLRHSFATHLLEKWNRFEIYTGSKERHEFI